MPTASEAAGRKNTSRCNCGESQERCSRAARRLRRKTQPPDPVPNSYLERFQQLKQRKKNQTDLLQGTYNNTNPRNYENYGSKEEQKTDSGASRASEEPASEDRSRLCVIL